MKRNINDFFAYLVKRRTKTHKDTDNFAHGRRITG
jgi:hypothetical protein